TMRRKFIILSFVILLLQQANAQVQISDLRCELLIDPLGIDIKQPRLSWQINSSQRNVQQTAYHIIVSTDKEKLDRNEGDIRNSGEINSSQSINVPYLGNALLSGKKYYWKVKVFT